MKREPFVINFGRTGFQRKYYSKGSGHYFPRDIIHASILGPGAKTLFSVRARRVISEKLLRAFGLDRRLDWIRFNGSFTFPETVEIMVRRSMSEALEKSLTPETNP